MQSTAYTPAPLYPPFFGPAKDLHFFRAKSLSEALDLLAQHGERASVLAGGTSLMLSLRTQVEDPEAVVYIGELQELNFIRSEPDGLHIGPLTKQNDLIKSAVVRERAPILAQAASEIAGPAVRNQATIGGNLVRGYDLAPPLLALDAQVVIASPEGQRTVPLKDFYLGPFWNVLKANEIVVDIHLPASSASQGFASVRRRKANDFALAEAAVALAVDASGVCREARIGIGFGFGVTFPTRAGGAEAELVGKAVTDEVVERAGRIAADESNPPDDGHATEWYRRKAIGVCVERAINTALGRPIR